MEQESLSFVGPQVPLLAELKQQTILLTKMLGVMADFRNTAQEEFLSVRQVAMKLNKSTGTIRRWIAERRIDAVQVQGSRYMIPKSAVERIIAAGGPAPFPIHCEIRSVKGG